MMKVIIIIVCLIVTIYMAFQAAFLCIYYKRTRDAAVKVHLKELDRLKAALLLPENKDRKHEIWKQIFDHIYII